MAEGGTLADALAALAPLEESEPAAARSVASPLIGSAVAGAAAAVTVWDQRVFARDVRRQNAEMLLAAPTHGAKRIAACCTQRLEPLELRGHLLHASGPNPPTLEEHLTVARPVLDVCSAAVQLLLGLPAASTSRPGAGA